MLHLKGTVATPPSHLSHPAHLALLFAQEWGRRAGGLKVPAAAVLRLALLRYADGLSTANPRTEWQAIKRASEAPTVADEERQLAQLRLYSVGRDEALPVFADVLHGHGRTERQAQAHVDLDARAEAMAAELIASRRPRKVKA
jgi:hypothetical protein